MIHFCEFRANQYYKLASFSIFVMASLFLMLIFTRGHYFIDLFCAVIFGHYFFDIAERLSYLVDAKLFGIPFHKRFPNFAKNCWNCKYPINQWLNVNINTHSHSSGRDSKDSDVKDVDKEFSYSQVKSKQMI